ncbi:MAG: hypothetical protein ACP5OO_13330 [Chloroflexia bacterium]
MRTKMLITGLLLLVLVVVVWTAFERGYPRAQAGSVPPVPVRATCGPCPDDVGGWIKVSSNLEWSGCVDAECWSVWNSQVPNHLMEKVGDRCCPGQSTPDAAVCNPVPNSTPPNIIYDPRANCEGVPAKGTWYHNAFARPVWDVIRDPISKQPLAVCTWKMDLSRQYWNFAENDYCRVCEDPAPIPGPTVTPGGPTVTPQPTECRTTPMIYTPAPPETPTPFVPNPPTFEPRAYIHSRYDPDHGVYPAQPTFYWPWQEFLHVSLSAQVQEPSQPGCAASTQVKAYWFEGSRWNYRGQTVVREVCPVEGNGDPNCRWRPVYEGRVGKNVYPEISREEWIHLLWAYSSTEVRSRATWAFYPVGPIWVEIHYYILAVTTYTCGGFTYTAPWTGELTLRVGLLRAVITGGR